MIELLVTDLDNTLWDWFHVWYTSFSAFQDRLVELTDLPLETLQREFREVHQRAGTTEYTFVLDEMPSLISLAAPRKPSAAFKEALACRAEIRRRETRLYPGVRETLKKLRAASIPVVAFTESNAYWTEWRIRKTELDGLIEVLYSAPDQGFPASLDRSIIRTLANDNYGLKATIHKHTPPGFFKPDLTIINSIVSDYGVAKDRILYVGDSQMKDVTMANGAGVPSAWAKYGVASTVPEYDLLRRVTHWTDRDVQREMDIASGRPPDATFTLEQGFWELEGICNV